MAELSENIFAGWLNRDPESGWETASDFTQQPTHKFLSEDGHLLEIFSGEHLEFNAQDGVGAKRQEKSLFGNLYCLF